MKIRNVLTVLSMLGLAACAGYHNPNGSESIVQTVQGNPAPVDFAEVSKVFNNNRCMNCHSGSNPDAHLDLTVYAQAKTAAKAIQGDVDSGDMPRNGPHLNSADQAMVDTWVLQGAADTQTPPTVPAPTVVGFTQVTVVFQNNKCLTCHSGSKPAAKIDLTQYAVAKANAADIQKDVQSGKMPKKANPLNSADLAVIDAWIQGGTPN
jgi:nitrate reductase cytochrome c-type subunit